VSVLELRDLVKRYGAVTALDGVSLDIRPGEIFGLLGPNGAGKTTLIGAVCGLVKKTSGTIRLFGQDQDLDPVGPRYSVGLVPQEINFDPFFTVEESLRIQLGYYGKPPDRARIAEVLAALKLSDKAKARTRQLSGGMKRRLLIAKALVHRPKLVFLDEPTAGVDVELRRDMWALVRRLRESGVTIILTTHYIDEAEEMADRIGVINKGELVVVEEKAKLMRKLGKKQLTVHLQEPMATLPAALADWPLVLGAGGSEIEYTFDGHEERTGIPALLKRLGELGIGYRDLNTRQSSLEDIFVTLVTDRPKVAA